MKKTLYVSLVAGAYCAFSALLAFAEPAVCTQYYKEMQAALKKDGNDTAAAMKIIKEQVAGVPAGRQADFCKSSLQGMKDAEAHASQAEADDDGGKNRAARNNKQ